MNFKKILIFALILCFAVSAINAADNETTFSHLQDVIDNANAGDTVYLNESYYTPDGATSGITISKDITISGGTEVSPDLASTIDGAGTVNLFTVDNCTVTFLNIKFANGTSTSANGGAIFADAADVTVKDCEFTNNAAANGGAIYSSGTLTVDNSKFNDNVASSLGSAIYSEGNLDLSNSVFTDYAEQGYATVYLAKKGNDGSVNLDSNEINSNIIPIYNKDATIESPTKLVVLNNDTKKYEIDTTTPVWAHLYDDNDNIIGSEVPVIINIPYLQDNITTSFLETDPFYYISGDVDFEEEGNFTATASYANANNVAVSNALIEVGQFATDLSIEIDDVEYGTTVEGYVYLYDADGEPLDGEVNVTIGNWTTTVEVEDGEGYFVMDDILEVGEYNATATYAGEGTYNPSEANTTFQVTKVQPTIDVTAEVNGDEVVITVALSNNITGNVTVEVAGETYNVEVVDGIGVLTIAKPAVGTYDVTVIYNETEDYANATGSTTFTVSQDNPGDNNSTNTSTSDSGAELNKKSELETGNPIALLLLALLVLPIRRFRK